MGQQRLGRGGRGRSGNGWVGLGGEDVVKGGHDTKTIFLKIHSHPALMVEEDELFLRTHWVFVVFEAVAAMMAAEAAVPEAVLV